MNEQGMDPLGAQDEEVLRGIRRHMAASEPLVPQPPAWRQVRGDRAMIEHTRGANVRVRAIGALGLGGLAVVAVVAVAAGLLLPGNRQGQPVGPASGSSASPIGPVTTISMSLVTPDGSEPSRADLDKTVEIMQARLAAAGAAWSGVTAVPPDRVTVEVAEPADAARTLDMLEASGRLEVVPLPPADYGTADVPGTKTALNGSPIDPALPELLSSSDIESGTFRTDDQTNGSWAVRFNLKAEAAARFAAWSAAHGHEFFALVLDGTVLSVPYVAEPITDGAITVAGGFTADEARQLATTLEFGSLPVPVTGYFVEASSDNPGTSGGSSAVAPLAMPSAAPLAGIAKEGRALGDPGAPVTMDVWADFRCTACRAFEQDTEPGLIDAYVRRGKLRIVYHDFLVIDANAGGTESRDAANAARCAADQGRFWDYKDWLLANESPSESSGSFTLDRLVAIGRAAGLDMGSFEPCVRRGTHDSAVTVDQPSFTITGVPTVLINGVAMGQGVSAPTYEELAAAIDSALRSAAIPTPAATTPVPTSTPTPASSGTAVPSPTGVVESTFQFYVVESGDTWQSIADKLGISTELLQAANPDVAEVTPGQTLFVPGPNWSPGPMITPAPSNP